MRRLTLWIAAIGPIFVMTSAVAAQSWPRALFAETKYDFGAVARYAKAEHVFEFTNKLNQDLHIAWVRRSCGCTTPEIEKGTIRPGEKGAVTARLNTRGFSGQVGSTITVVFDQPQYAEIQLRVDAYIRRDIVFDPGEVDFGTVPEGRGAERIVDLDYAGREDWAVVNVRSPSPHITVETKETVRGDERVHYQFVVRLAKDAPPEDVGGELLVETSDHRLARVPLAVAARVTPALSVSPALLRLGQVQPGAIGTGRLVVRGATPFHITTVECPDPRFTFQPPTGAKTLHFIPVAFAAGQQPGEVATQITVHTDLGDGRSALAKAAITICEPE